MQINMQGLKYETQSPSCYRLVSVVNDVGPGAHVFVAFDGHSWGICYLSPEGKTKARGFASRDHAAHFIAHLHERVA